MDGANFPSPQDADIDLVALERSLRHAVEGEVRFDRQARALYSTDASNYRETPLGVVVPLTDEDVVQTVRVCRRFGAPITSRGGGTSLAGQCCNVAVVIDFSKHLNRVLEIDPEARTAWVQPGCVLDDLRDAAREHGLTFGPDPSTHNHNTLGGMIGNNSCGVHSIMGGRTADNIEELDVLTYDGLRMNVGPVSEEELGQIIAGGGRKGEIHRKLRDLRDRCAGEVRRQFPDLPRRVSGFNLTQLLPENGFHVARALVGSEGGCVVVLRAMCRLLPDPPKRVVLAAGFEDICLAADAVPDVMEAGPIGLEGIDHTLVAQMRDKSLNAGSVKILPEGDGWLLVEIGADTAEEAEEKAKRLKERLEGRASRPSVKLLTDPAEQAAMWKVREAGLPATAHVPGLGETHEGWEDAAVPPERLGAYLREFRALLEEFGYSASTYGHFGDGCVHCRIDFDFTTEAGVAHFRRFIDRGAELVVKHGGSLSGEHGDGQARGQLLHKMFGPDILSAFQEFKAIWDPDWRLNPGKMPKPDAPDRHLRTGPDFEPWVPKTRMAMRVDDGDFVLAANRCVGVGKCRKHDSGVMCPSYMATMEETHSTRGRARLLFEMVDGGVIKDGWRSQEVHDALDLCLACKACKTECPVNVDMATYKTEFMHQHWKGRVRPRSAYSMGLIWWWSRLATKMPGLANWVAQGPLASTAKKLGGFAQARRIPEFPKETFHEWFRKRKGKASDKRVLLWADTFNAYLTPGPLKAATELLEEAGWQVEVAERVCCGRPLYAFGMLDTADRVLGRSLERLRPWLREGVPVVGLEPSCVSALKDELLEMRPNDRDARRLADHAWHLADFLLAHGYEPPKLDGELVLHMHCHHRSVLKSEAEVELLRKTGVDLTVLDDGCCGMAGDYGFRDESYEASLKVGERRYLPAVRAAGKARVMTDAYSCREQARQQAGRTPLTLPEVLLEGHRAAQA